jgi:hypothetical protein
VSRRSVGGGQAAGSMPSKWKARSEQLRLAMKAARGDDQAGTVLMTAANQAGNVLP